MSVPPGTRSPIPPLPRTRNAGSPAPVARGPRPAGGGALLLALVWATALAFFVLGVAAPAAMLHRQGGRTEVAAAAP